MYKTETEVSAVIADYSKLRVKKRGTKKIFMISPASDGLNVSVLGAL